MKSTEFAYWLQGFFELSGDSIKELNEKHCVLIKKHLELVFTYDKTPSKFCIWLKGVLDSADIACGNSEDLELNQDFTNLIKKELASIFKHEIDSSYGSDIQDALNNIHSNTNESTIYRC